MAGIRHSSLLSLFPEESIKTLISHEASEETKIKFPFLHQSVKDFVTAKWLTENYHVHRSFIQDKYFEIELQTMWAVYDWILANQYKLHISVLYRDIEKVRDLVSSGVDINAVDNGDRTTLHLAAIQGKYLFKDDSL